MCWGYVGVLERRSSPSCPSNCALEPGWINRRHIVCDGIVLTNDNCATYINNWCTPAWSWKRLDTASAPSTTEIGIRSSATDRWGGETRALRPVSVQPHEGNLAEAASRQLRNRSRLRNRDKRGTSARCSEHRTDLVNLHVDESAWHSRRTRRGGQ